jgi:hypothetical protein
VTERQRGREGERERERGREREREREREIPGLLHASECSSMVFHPSNLVPVLGLEALGFRL